MKVLVAGARSALGSRVVRLLVADGHEVFALTRTPSYDGPARPVVADVLDAGATRAAVLDTQPDAIVQTLNALPKQGPRRYADLAATSRLRVDGTRNLVAAARAAGVERYVAENFIFVYGTTPLGSPPITEDRPLFAGATGNDELDRSLAAMRTLEDEVLGFGGVVLRCGLFYGPGVGSTENLVAMVRQRRAPTIRGAPNVLPYAHIDDVAAAVVAALQRGRPGEAYIVADDEPLGPNDFVRELAAVVGAKPPRAVPVWVVRLLAGQYLASTLQSNLAVANGKARRELGWAPAYPSIREGLKTVAG
jgi:nucleoside-diphosphate-sugar epimerase